MSGKDLSIEVMFILLSDSELKNWISRFSRFSVKILQGIKLVYWYF